MENVDQLILQELEKFKKAISYIEANKNITNEAAEALKDINIVKHQIEEVKNDVNNLINSIREEYKKTNEKNDKKIEDLKLKISRSEDRFNEVAGYFSRINEIRSKYVYLKKILYLNISITVAVIILMLIMVF